MPLTTIRDPLWGTIRLDPLAERLVDAAPFQRLRHIRQLGWAFLVYPGATHSRFEHAVGAYHLAGLALARLDEAGALTHVSALQRAEARMAALLHDIGHYPFSHALEEIGLAHHEALGQQLVTSGVIAELLAEALGPDAPANIAALIRGASRSPLQGLIAGSLDLDKLEYLRRDARMCGVPYGDIDVDRLLHAMTIVPAPAGDAVGQPTLGIAAKGLSALESLLFAKYQMYRNVYWHHAVRSATAMYKRLVDDAARAGRVDVARIGSYSDEGLLHALDDAGQTPMLDALRTRRLFKRALDVPAAELDDPEALDWISDDRERARAAEDALARTHGLAPGDLLLDYPAKTQMLGLDIPVVKREGSVEWLTTAGMAGAIDLPLLSTQFYRSARWLRVFSRVPLHLDAANVLAALR
ncbi:MAG: HD domain-containing protein [Gemmatimonadaceae bacterium]|nr:HD domain-containing protein [Gemmatimonadaceae bacterium]